ncbi:MAG TPA: pseudouridine-5'-phosphate glycosidase [Candidatus Limnocylindrales bacterium]|nr:pseudouridine-5'-phosphate glycosidase [Candidatus Limnocylindrales bacterium]
MADSLASAVRFGHACFARRLEHPAIGPELMAASVVDRLVVAPEVHLALAEGRPVVALESTLISHGLPYPQNIEVAAASEAAVRETDGAVPATVAISAGRILVGLDEAALEALATAPSGSVRKAARPSLAVALAEGGWAATTVSATMIAAAAAGIRVFATGGIGGVHRGALGGTTPTLDVSSDLEELGRTAMAVVCAGPKAILDVPATLEYLETRGVPVIAVGQAELPGFYARSSGIAAPFEVADLEAAGALVAAHLGLGLGSAVLVCVPVPADAALPDGVAREAVERAVREADTAGIGGPALTPWLLARIAILTDGASVRANTALIINDARAAGALAGRLAVR